MLNITHGREITAPDRRSIDLSHDPIDFGCEQNDFDRHQNDVGYHQNDVGYHQNDVGYHQNDVGYHQSDFDCRQNGFGHHQNDVGYHQNDFDCDQTDSIAPIALSVITTILTDKELPRFPPTGDDLTSHPDLNVEREPERD
jgi:hypothetical protein